PVGLVDRGRRLGVDLNRPHLLLVAEAGAAVRERLAGAAVQYLFGSGSVSAEHAGASVLLLPCGDGGPGEAARAAAGQLTQLVGVLDTVAGAGPAAGPRAIADAYAEAARCLRALRVLGRDVNRCVRRRTRLSRGAVGQGPRRGRFCHGHPRTAAGLRRPARHPARPHPARLLRLRREPDPGEGRTARAHQHRRAAAGPGADPAGSRLEQPGAGAGAATRPTAASVDCKL
ncbi:LOW QUALITY PROTEIN: GAF domain-containing protein, partial [Streptomyces sp. e14]